MPGGLAAVWFNLRSMFGGPSLKEGCAFGLGEDPRKR